MSESEAQYLAIGVIAGLSIASIIVTLVLRWLNNNPPNFFR